MRKTKSKPSSRKKKASKPRRTRSAPAKMGSRKKSRKKTTKSRKRLTVVPPSIPQWDPRAAHPDQYMRIQMADDYLKGKKIPASHVKVVKKRGGKRRKKTVRRKRRCK